MVALGLRFLPWSFISIFMNRASRPASFFAAPIAWFMASRLSGRLRALRSAKFVDQFAQSSPSHGAFFVDAFFAFCEHVSFAVVGQEFHAHVGPRLFPIALGEFLFKVAEFSFWGADEVAHGWPARPHDC